MHFRLDFGKAFGGSFSAKAIRLWLDPFIRETLTNMIVWPNRLVVPMLPEEATGSLDHLYLRSAARFPSFNRLSGQSCCSVFMLLPHNNKGAGTPLNAAARALVVAALGSCLPAGVHYQACKSCLCLHHAVMPCLAAPGQGTHRAAGAAPMFHSFRTPHVRRCAGTWACWWCKWCRRATCGRWTCWARRTPSWSCTRKPPPPSKRCGLAGRHMQCASNKGCLTQRIVPPVAWVELLTYYAHVRCHCGAFLLPVLAVHGKGHSLAGSKYGIALTGFCAVALACRTCRRRR